MARIDVSALMTDPDFADEFILVRRVISENEHGETSLQEARVPVTGVVQPANAGEVRELIPEGMRLVDAINVWCKDTPQTHIAPSEGLNGYSDQVLWRGRKYTVVAARLFGNWGAGYCKATCILEAVNDE